MRDVINAATGVREANFDYTPYGTEIIPPGQQGPWQVDFRHAGLYGANNSGGGLQYSNTRIYDPRLGRWLSRDPIIGDGGTTLYASAAQGLAQPTEAWGPTRNTSPFTPLYNANLEHLMGREAAGGDEGSNLYQYVGGDPINRVDPNGTFWVNAAGCAFGAVTGVIGLTAGGAAYVAGRGVSGKCPSSDGNGLGVGAVLAAAGSGCLVGAVFPVQTAAAAVEALGSAYLGGAAGGFILGATPD